MARGFAKGLVQGAILSGVALAALSLILPQPQVSPQAVTRTTTGAEASAATGADLAAARQPSPQTATPATPEGATGPAMGVIEVPAGSEFARSDDSQPLLPAPLTRPEAPSPGTQGATIIRPADETAPAPATATAGRPATRAEAPGAPEAPLSSAPAIEVGDLPSAPSNEAPIPVAPPGRVATPALDRMPETAGGRGEDTSLPRSGLPGAVEDGPAMAREIATDTAPETLSRPSALGPSTLPTPGRPEAAPTGGIIAEARGEADAEETAEAALSQNEARPESAASGAAPATGDTASQSHQPHSETLPAAKTDAKGRTAPDLSLPPDLGNLGLTP